MLIQPLPAFEIIVLQFRQLDGVAREPHGVAALEHERHGVFDLVRLELGVRRALPGVGVGAVGGHAIVQAGAAGQKTFGLGVVDAVQQAHELGHDVAVIPRRPERVLADEPARREDDEIDCCGARHVGRRGEHAVDRRIGMIEAHGADHHEAGEIVFVRREIAVPGDDVERRVIHLRRPQIALEFGDHGARRLGVLVSRDGAEKIAHIGKAVGAERAELRQPQRDAVILADIAARRPVRQLDAKAQAARNDDDLAGRRLDDAELGDEARAAELRHDQHFAVGIVEAAIGHRAVGGIDVHAHADLRGDVAVAAHGHHALDKVGGLLRNRDRAPAQLRRRRVDVVERRAANEAVVDARIGPVHDRGLDAIGPGAPVLAARRRERGARDQLGVQAVRRPLRRIAADRQRAGDCFRNEMIAEAGLVLQRRGRARRSVVRFAGFGIHATSRRRVRRQLVSIATNIRFPGAGRKHLGTVPS